MVRKFLYFIAAGVFLVLAVSLALSIWADDLTELAFVPESEFTPQPPLDTNVYADLGMWVSRPGMGAGDPAQWLPEGMEEEEQAAEGATASLHASVFFIHPTSYLAKDHWNAPLDDKVSRERAELFVKGMASPFNTSPDIWVPRYRQAAAGAFLTSEPQAEQALDAAYRDILEAFDFFAGTTSETAPIILAGHSQGAFHLRRLMQDRVAGTPLQERVAAVYAIGWPISIEHDLPQMGLPACTAPDEAGCIASWSSYAEPADNGMMRRAFARRPGLDGQTLGEGPILCTNPLTGEAGANAPASANRGTMIPDLDMETGNLVPAMVPARCGKDGFLYIGDPPDLGSFVLPGNNYHLYDIPLFWANLRADAVRRVEAWQRAH